MCLCYHMSQSQSQRECIKSLEPSFKGAQEHLEPDRTDQPYGVPNVFRPDL